MDGRGEPHAVALDRGPAVAVELRGRGPVAALRAIGAALRRRSLRAVVTTAPAGAAHAAGWALRRRGLPWIAVVDGRLAVEAPDRWHRAFDPRLRALRRASLLVATDATEAARMHHELGLAPAVAGPEASAAARHLLQPRASGALRVLMLGTLNAPHVEHLALAMRERGMDVIAGGDLTPAYPRTVLPDAGVPTSVLTLPAIPWLRRLLREQRPDVVHAHWLYGAAFLAAVAGAKPLIAMAWGSDVYAAEPRHLQMGRFALRRAAVAMTDSADLVGRLIEMGADPAATHVLNWGVDLDRFSPGDRTAARAALGLPDVPTILSPRAITPLYNQRTIVEAFTQVRRRVLDAQLVLKHIAADPPDLGKLPEGVTIVGHVPHERMADFYRAADVTVSIPSSDSSPRSVWEAMACGSPTVVSDLPWVSELIEDGRHALVVPIDATAVASAIERVLGDPALSARLGAEGRDLTARERDREREMDRLAAQYEALAR